MYHTIRRSWDTDLLFYVKRGVHSKHIPLDPIFVFDSYTWHHHNKHNNTIRFYLFREGNHTRVKPEKYQQSIVTLKYVGNPDHR